VNYNTTFGHVKQAGSIFFDGIGGPPPQAGNRPSESGSIDRLSIDWTRRCALGNQINPPLSNAGPGVAAGRAQRLPRRCATSKIRRPAKGRSARRGCAEGRV